MGRKTEKEHRRNPWVFLAPLLVFAVGAGIFLYPAVSNFLAERAQTDVIRSYQAAVDESDRQKLEAEWQKAEEYNENLAGDPVHDPFVMGSGYVLPDNYEEVLNLNGDGVMGYLEIPKIDVELPVYHGTSEKVLEKGAGHLEATALPIGGKNRHPVISAHRGLPSAELFTQLDEMEVGDRFYLSVLDETLAYEVDKITVIEPEELEFLTPEKDRDLLTLLTCTPYGVNTHRLLVRGTRVPYEEAESTKTGKESERDVSWRAQYLRAALTGAALLAVLGLIVFGRRRRRGRHRDSN